jgi:TupA-like ATPgrasp
MKQLFQRPIGWLRIIRCVRRSYKLTLGRRLHLFRPRRYTEKMQWRKLFDLDPIYAVFCDKVATRQYVTQRLGPDATVPILWLGENPAAVPFEQLRPPYIVKCSHGSGWNIVVRNTSDNDFAAMRACLERWLATDYGTRCFEPGYSEVPRRLLVEPLLTHQGGFPLEFKFFMFNGATRRVMLRANYGDGARDRVQAYYDTHWRLLPVRTSDMPPSSAVPRPPEFDRMRTMAEALARDRDHLRVDFLVSDRHVYVGELTCYHRGGLFRFDPDAEDFELGESWTLKKPILRALQTIVGNDWRVNLAGAGPNP